MSMKQISTILVGLALITSFQAKADWQKADNYRQSDKTDLYLAASLNAYTAANVNLEGLNQSPLYCQPEKVDLGPEHAVSIFEKELQYRMMDGSRNSPFWKETDLEYVLLWGLQRAFPCE